MIKNLLTYRTGFLLKTVFFLSLFLALGTTVAKAQFAITEDFRGAGNPDIIIGGPGGADGTAVLTSGTTDPLNAGWLRLTNSNQNQKGFAYVNKQFPSTLGVLVDFEYKMWRNVGDTYNGADGIGVFLFDAGATFQLGGYGGSLGYSPGPGIATGLAGGYVGIGLDAYGNNANPIENKIGGPGVRPNAIVMRGPTTSVASTTNRFLTGTTIRTTDGITFNYLDIVGNTGVNTEDALDFNTQQTTRPTNTQFYRRVQLEITRLDAAGIYYNVLVRWKTSPTGNFVYVTDYTTTDVPPSLLKLGFAAASGGGVNFHEIRNLLVTTPGNLRVVKRADKDILRTNSAANGTITYTIEVTNDTDFEIPSISFSDKITDSYGNLIPEGTTGFDITSITTTGFVTAAMPTVASLTTNEISGNLVLAANTTGYITIVGRLYTLPDGSVLQNTATALPPLDDDLNNNTSIVRTPVTAENVDLLLTKMVTEQCINASTAPTFTVYVSNNGAVGTSFRRLGYNGTRVAFYNVVPPGYTYSDSSTPGGFAGSNGTGNDANSNVTSRWSKITLANTPSANYTTYYYVARGTDAGGNAQTLASGATYPYPVTYTMQPSTGTTSYTDTSTAVLFTDYTYTIPIETAANQVNNDASIVMYIKPPAPAVPAGPLNYCVDEDAPELTATKSNPAYTFRWYMTANGFSSEFPIKPYTGASGTYTYYVSQVNGDCEGPQTPITVNVGPATTGTIAAATTAACPGSTVVISGDAIAGATYAWQSAVEGGTFTTISGATLKDYTTAALNETMYYRRLVTLTANGKTCTGPGNFVKIFVADPGVIGNSQAQCNDYNPAAFTNVTSGTNGTVGLYTYSYQWQISTDGTTWTGAGNGDISGATGATYDPPSTITATRYYRRLVRYNIGSLCSAASNVVVAFRGTGSAPAQGSIGSNQTICNGDTPAAFTTSGTPGAGYYQWEYSTTSTTAGFTIIPNASPTTGTYAPGPLAVTTYYRRTRISGCGTPTGVTVTVTVLNPTPGTIGTTQTICYNTAPTALSGSSGGLGVSYRWEMAEGTSGGTWGTAPGTSNGQNYTPGTLTTSKRYRRFTTTTTGILPPVTCESQPSNIVTIIVKPQVDAGTISGVQSICSGVTSTLLSGTAASSVDAITYQWERSNTSGGTYANATGTSTGQDYTATVTGYYRRRTITTCPGPFYSNIIAVSFQGTVPPGSITAPTVTTICYNGTATITGTAATPVTGTVYSYRWESSANSGGPFVTAAGTSNLKDYTTTALTATTYFRRVVISTINGNACESVPSATPVMITVQDQLVIGSISGPANGCNNGSVTIASDSDGAGSGTITYKWESSGTPGGTYTVIAGETGPTLTINPFTATRSYRRSTVSTLNSVPCTSGPTNIVTVALQNLPTGGVIAATASRVCSGGSTVINNSLSGGNFTSYQWQYSTTGSPFNWVDIPGATNPTYTTLPLTATTYFQRLSINQCGASSSGDIHIDVTTIDPGSLGADKTICNNTSPGALGSGTGTSAGSSSPSGVTYRWESAAGATGGTFAAIGQTGATYTPGNLTATIRYRRYTINTSNSVTCEAFAEILVTVQSVPAAASITAPTPSTVCSGANVTIGSGGVGTGDGTITYRWEAAPTSTGVYATVSGQTAATLTVNNITVSTIYRRYTVSTLNGVDCLSVATNTVTITVNTTNIDPGVIGTSQVVCSGTQPPTVTSQGATGTGASPYNYLWQYSTDGTTWINTSTISSDFYFSAPITQTMYFRRFGTRECTGVTPSNVVTYTVPTAPSAGQIGSNQTVCFSIQPDLLTSVSPGAGTGYQWQESNDGTSGWTNISGATGLTFLPPVTYTKYYRRLTLYSVSCGAPSNVVSVVVTGTSIDPGVISKNQTVCANQTPDILNYSNGGSGYAGSTGVYRWDFSTNGTTWNSTGTTTEFYTFSGPLAVTTYYRRASIGTTCSGEKYTNPITITVVPSPVGGTAGTNQTICNGGTPAMLTVTGSSTGTYRWEVSTSSSTGPWAAVSPAATNADYTPGALNATTYYRRATIAGSCGETFSTTVTITVSAAINGGTATANQNICNGGTTTALTVTGAAAGTYRWDVSTTSATGPWAPVSPAATGASYSPGTLTATRYYRRATISGSCEGYSNSITITVSATTTAGTIAGTQTICMDTAPTILGSVSTGLGTGSGTITYRWEYSANGSTGWTTIAGATGPSYQPLVLHATRYYRRTTIAASTVGGNTATCESPATGTVIVTTKNCKIITNPMVRSRVN